MHANMFWVRLANKISQRNKIDLKRFQNSRRAHPLTKLNTHICFDVDNYLALVGM
jgi:RNase adaptor protein for sRNA GlmZ degradation